MKEDIYFIDVSNVENLEESDVVIHTTSLDKAKEIANSYIDRVYDYCINIGTSYWENDVLQDNYQNIVEHFYTNERKEKLRLLNKSADTVGKLIELLKEVPKDYSVSLTGMNTYGVAINDKDKTILLDDVRFIEDLINEEE